MSEEHGGIEAPVATGLEPGDLTNALGDERTPAEKELATKTAEWDTTRQASDQTHANERKDLQDKLDTALELSLIHI